MFPMADGKVPASTSEYTNPYAKLETSALTMEDHYPFMNRDPRFYRTFAFPGFRWAYNGDASSIDPNNPSDGKNFVPGLRNPFGMPGFGGGFGNPFED